MLYEIKRCSYNPDAHYWCYPKFDCKSDAALPVEESFPDPRDFLVGFVHCENPRLSPKKRLSDTQSYSPARDNARHKGKTRSLITRVVDEYDKSRGEGKFSKTYKPVKNDALGDKMQSDIAKLYRKDVAQPSAGRVNFSNYLSFLQTLHKNEKKKPAEEEKNAAASAHSSKHPADSHRRAKKVDEVILDFIKERINPHATPKPKLPHKM